MYCPGCGAETPRGVSYCTRCGAGLAVPADRATPPAHPPYKVTAMFLGVTLLSIIVIIAIFATIANVSGLPPPFLTAVIFSGCAAAFGIVALLIRLVLRLTGLDRPDVIRDRQVFGGGQRELPPQQLHRQIPGPPQSVGSVTENTTRSFPAHDAARREN